MHPPRRRPGEAPRKLGDLTAAAADLDADLTAFELAVKDAGAVHLHTRKGLERCARELQAAADLHERLQSRVAALGAQLHAAQERAAAAATSLYERGMELGRRQGTYVELVQAYEILMAEAVAVRDVSNRGPEALDELKELLGALSERARELAEQAREAGFRDLAEDATARQQQLAALVGKLG